MSDAVDRVAFESAVVAFAIVLAFVVSVYMLVVGVAVVELASAGALRRELARVLVAATPVAGAIALVAWVGVRRYGRRLEGVSSTSDPWGSTGE